jgi:Rha family phage regulatory protein
LSQIALPDRRPVVFKKDGSVFANSRDVAEFFEKRHDHVMRDIDRLIEQEPSLARGHLPNFGEMAVEVEIGSGAKRLVKTYSMSRDGFTLLAMGFTGSRALQWKLRYIEAFNAMEAQLRQQVDPLAALNDPATMRNLLLSYSEKALALQAQVDDLKPSADALDRIAGTDGSLCIRDAAKTLQLRPN